MNDPPPSYLSYLLRLYPVQDGAQLSWRASLENVLTGERQGFASLEALMTFLEEHIGAQIETRTDNYPTR